MTRPEHVWSCWCEEVSAALLRFGLRPPPAPLSDGRRPVDIWIYALWRFATTGVIPDGAALRPESEHQAHSGLLSFRHVDWTACRSPFEMAPAPHPYGHCAGKENGNVARKVRRRCARPHHSSQAASLRRGGVGSLSDPWGALSLCRGFGEPCEPGGADFTGGCAIRLLGRTAWFRTGAEANNPLISSSFYKKHSPK
jgi:hypothetical protein